MGGASGAGTFQADKSWHPESLSIVGLGLLGASLAEAARKRWPDLRITGVSSASTLERARLAGLADVTFEYPDIDKAVAGADIVVLCTPIDHIKSILQAWTLKPPEAKPGCIITDVGSTKTEICALGRKAFPTYGKQGAVFIGSHPMAGSEKTGLEARDPLLFQNASWVLCAEEVPDETLQLTEAADRLQQFAQALGARTTRMTAELHDKVAAHVSHLPQLLSTALASYIGERRTVVENCLQIAGGGFRDMTRLAASSFSVWEPILKSNLSAVREVTAGFQEHLAAFEAGLEWDLGKDFFKEGNRLRSQLSTSKKGFVLPLAEILVDLEDKPGALVRAFSPLAEAGINVLDVEILKVREGEGGTLMMGFHGMDDANAALGRLAAAGFKARLR
ncbi:MAG: prephenate dehydrogenase/arogenate dehydrogenase family protein [Fibrobacterota bacterium]|nr:prephenate dehydrogenase/arogenate dehydrogenase family protein [Fibrobacterota bacterium]